MVVLRILPKLHNRGNLKVREGSCLGAGSLYTLPQLLNANVNVAGLEEVAKKLLPRNLMKRYRKKRPTGTASPSEGQGGAGLAWNLA